MKNLAVQLIELYQKILSLIFKNLLGLSYFCRFRPTCSEYAKIQIKKKGVLKGGYLSILRILKCQPFYKQKLSTFGYKQKLSTFGYKQKLSTFGYKKYEYSTS